MSCSDHRPSRSAPASVRAARRAVVAAVLGVVLAAVGPALAEPPAGTAPAPEVSAAPEAPTVPFGWTRESPALDPLPTARTSRLIARLGIPEAQRAEALYGPPTEGEVRGWWLRPVGPMRSGAWLLMSAAGGLYAVLGPPELVDDPAFVALGRAGRRWAMILRGR